MAEIKPDSVNSFTDARGKRRHQFRRKGHKKVTIKGRPGSQEFMEHYQALLNQTGGSVVAEAGASRIKAKTVDALIVKYLKDDRFKKGLAPASQKMRRPILDAFREHLTPNGRRYGDNHFRTLQQDRVRDVFAVKSYASQMNWLKTLRHLFKFAIDEKEKWPPI